jgi:hypothetical protein
MRKLFLTLAVLVMAICANAQTNQYFWYKGNLMYGTSIVQTDKITFGDDAEVDTLHLLLPRSCAEQIVVKETIKVEVHDTLFIYMPEKVDLGLPSGLKWASLNVGANSPYDYGFYFQWGCLNGTHQEGWDLYCHGNKNAITKYCTNSSYGTVDNLSILEESDDAAKHVLGGSWRMPTKAEAEELWNNCTRTWETIGDVSGFRFTGPNGNSIFLPSNGWWDEQGAVHSLNVDGLYWTSSLYTDNNNSAWGLITRKTTGNAGVLMGSENRNFARGIRAVCP